MNVLSLLCLVACTQANDPSQKLIERYEVKDLPIRSVLADLFEEVKTQVVISEGVQGKVTLSVEGKTFEVTFQQALKQVEATYRVDDGRYWVVPKGEGNGCLPDVPTYTVSDSEYDYVLEWHRLSKVRRATGDLVSIIELERRHSGINADLSTAAGQKQLREFAELCDCDAVVRPGFKGIVRLPPGLADNGFRFGSLEEWPAVPVFKDGRLQLPLVPLSKYAFELGFELWRKQIHYTEPTLSQGRLHVEVGLGRWQCRVRKSDLKVEGWSAREKF